MKKLLILLCLLLTSCQKISAKENKTLSVGEAHIEKQIAQLKFCEAIFETKFFHFTEQEQLIQGRDCYFLWNQDPEKITETFSNHPKLAKQFKKEVILSKEKAKNKKWIQEAKAIYDTTIHMEAAYLSIENSCQFLIKNGYAPDHKEEIDECIKTFQENYFLRNTFSIKYK